MPRTTQEQLERLKHWFEQCESVLVAYSGGVDSSLLMAVAYGALGDKTLACIGVSPSYPAREMRQAVQLAQQLDVPYRRIDTQEHLDENYTANASNRCYFCKNELYGKLRRIAAKEGWGRIVDGTNQSDLGDDRPGRAAAAENSVRSPLVELEITKAQVRQLAQHLDLPVWDKPAMACLSSRVPHGTPITAPLLRLIEEAEDVLVEHGFRQFRVRHHGDTARIELLDQDMQRALAKRDQLIAGIRRAGYRNVCLDLAGYRSGSDHTTTAGQTVPLTVEGAE